MPAVGEWAFGPRGWDSRSGQGSADVRSYMSWVMNGSHTAALGWRGLGGNVCRFARAGGNPCHVDVHVPEFEGGVDGEGRVDVEYQTPLDAGLQGRFTRTTSL